MTGATNITSHVMNGTFDDRVLGNLDSRCGPSLTHIHRCGTVAPALANSSAGFGNPMNGASKAPRIPSGAFVASHDLRWGSQEDRKVCRFMRKLRSRFANPACPITMGFGNVW